MTQMELAAAGGLQFQQIQKYECAANAMSAQRLWLLATCLGVTVSYFYDGLVEAAAPVCAPSDAQETAELVRVLAALGERSRRELLVQMRSMNAGAAALSR